MRSLPALVAAAAPARLMIAWVDRRPDMPATLPASSVTQIDARAARTLAERFAGPGYGLPFAAVLGDGDRLCAVWPRPLRPEDVARLLRSCVG